MPGTMLEETGILGGQGERENGLGTRMQKKGNHDDDGNCCQLLSPHEVGLREIE